MKLLLVLLLAISGAAQATSWDRLSVQKLYDAADAVAYVEIIGGEKLTDGETSCGAKYEARVIRRFKGEEQEKFSFAYSTGPTGLEIEGHYILFLTSKIAKGIGVVSTNSLATEAQAEFQSKCAHLLYGFQPIPAYGVVNVKHSMPLGGLAVEVPDRYIAFPDTIKRTSDNFGSVLELYETVWIDLDDVLNDLNSLRDKD